MISAKPTEHLTGITLEGEFQDFYEIVESIYRMTGLEDDYKDRYWGVKNRLLGMCYDIRHAYMGDREVNMVDNGVHDELMKWHSMIMPKQNVHFSANFIFIEAVYVALAVPDMYIWSSPYYGERAKKGEAELPVNLYSEYVRDKAVLDLFSATILQALGTVIGDEELRKLLRFREHRYEEHFANYVTQYVDKCNLEYLKTAPDKRKDKLRNIARRLVQKPASYNHMKWDLEYTAREYNCHIYELHDPKLEYPQEIEW